MREFRIFLAAVSITVCGWTALAQEPQEPIDPMTLRDRPQPSSTPSTSYPDIESLREPGSTEKLFPAATPPPVLDPNAPPGTPQAGAAARGRHGGGILGRKSSSGRQRDTLVDQADSDPLTVRVAYRRAKTLAMVHDPGMADLLHQAAAAGTDVDKRAILKQYYTRLYAGVLKADTSPEMKKHVETLQLVASARYDPKRRTVGGEEDIVLGRGGGRRGGRNR